MRLCFRTAAAGVVLAGALMVSAVAADYTTCADHLKELNLFQGTDQGYDLDRTPTRAEAAAMLVRLLGAEEEALALEYHAPFTDLKNWEKPYIQYLYQNDLTTGISDTEFAPSKPCTAQMYAAFLLRALGYSEADGDFTYAQAVTAAQEHGVYDPAVVDRTDFLRDDVVAASYTALSVVTKDRKGTLLDRLVDNGAVDVQAAEPYQELFDNYVVYREDTAAMQQLEHFSVKSCYLSPVTFRNGNVQGNPIFTLQISDTTTFDREANAMLTDSTRMLTASGVTDKSVLSQIYLSDGTLQQKVDEGWYSETVTAQEQARLLSAYAPVPIVWVQEMAQVQKGSWTNRFSQIPPIYSGWMQPVESTVGDLDEAVLYYVAVKQNTNGGKIVSQGLTVEFNLDGIYGQTILVSTLDKTGNDALLTPPV